MVIAIAADAQTQQLRGVGYINAINNNEKRKRWMES
jgi:hypothetical protein